MPFTSRWMLRTRRSARCSGVSLAGTGFVTDISCPPRPSVVKALSVARASHTAVEAGAHRASRLPAPGRLLSASSPRTSGARPPEACGIPRGRRGAERGRRRGGPSPEQPPALGPFQRVAQCARELGLGRADEHGNVHLTTHDGALAQIDAALAPHVQHRSQPPEHVVDGQLVVAP